MGNVSVLSCKCCMFVSCVHSVAVLNVPSICFVCVFVCRKLSPHLRVSELDHRCLLFLSCFFG